MRDAFRLYQPQLAQTLREGANIRLALDIPALAAPSFVAALFGGRVLSVTGLGPTVREAADRAYDGMRRIAFDGMHYRRDIGAREAHGRT